MDTHFIGRNLVASLGDAKLNAFDRSLGAVKDDVDEPYGESQRFCGFDEPPILARGQHGFNADFLVHG